MDFHVLVVDRAIDRSMFKSLQFTRDRIAKKEGHCTYNKS